MAALAEGIPAEDVLAVDFRAEAALVEDIPAPVLAGRAAAAPDGQAPAALWAVPLPEAALAAWGIPEAAWAAAAEEIHRRHADQDVDFSEDSGLSGAADIIAGAAAAVS
ncbi:MAG: hypothetical protein LUD16_02565 [Lachnospiraceae bacterium]|nr:hypothetical protein [Lachnospiraceae bacterium]